MLYPVLAQKDTWYTQGGNSISRGTITEIAIRDTYKPKGEAIRWDASAGKNGSVNVYLEGTKLTIAGNGSGKIQANEQSGYLFCDSGHKDYYSSLTKITGLNLLDVSKVQRMNNAFSNCFKLESIDATNWSLDSCTLEFGMMSVFAGCNFAELDLSGWNVDNVTDVNHFFADNKRLRKVNISGWKLKEVKNIAAFFNDCTSLTEVDVSGLDTGKCAAFSQMFERCTSLRRIIGIENLDVSNAGREAVSRQGSFFEMFKDCESLETLDISNWNMSGASQARKDDAFDFLSGMKRLKQIKLPASYPYNAIGDLSLNPLLPTPNPSFIPGADGKWYDVAGKSYAPEEAIQNVPNTYYASKALVEDKDVVLKNKTLIGIGQAIRNKLGDEGYRRPSEMKQAIEKIGGGEDISLQIKDAALGEGIVVASVQNGKPTAWKPKKYTLNESAVVDMPLAQFSRNLPNAKEVLIRVICESNVSEKTNLRATINNDASVAGYCNAGLGEPFQWMLELSSSTGLFFAKSVSANNKYLSETPKYTNPYYIQPLENIKQFTITATSGKIPAGTQIEIWVV